MRNIDFSPLFRATIGFDRLSQMLDSAARLDDGALSYPPYNIEKTGEDAYRLTMAVAGFSEDDLTVSVENNVLTVIGKSERNGEGRTFLHRGIAGRSFERRFDLAEHIRVTGAQLLNGLLHVDLVREVPEAMRPRTIKIETSGNKPKIIENKAA